MLRVGANRQMMLAQIDRMAIGDMPDFDPSMKKAVAGLAGARMREQAHDHRQRRRSCGAERQARSPRSRTAAITVTTVAVGSHGPAGSPTMQNIADADAAASITSSTTPTRCRRFFSGRRGGLPGRWCTSRSRR